MGRSYTPKYRVEFTTTPGAAMTPSGWEVKTNGKANVENLARYCESMNASFLPGGVNEQAGKVNGGLMQIVKATLIRQLGNVPIAIWGTAE